MANPLRLWINAETGRLLSSVSSFTSAQPQTFHAGDTVPLELHLVAGAGVARVPYEVPFPAGSTVKVAVGTVARAPLGGQWRLSVSSTETADLAYNASPSAVQTALNALSAVSTAGGVTVESLGGGYSITWNTVGTKPPILAGSDTLTPASYESILTLQTGDVSTREIIFVELRQTPLALATSFSPIGAPSISTSTVSAWNGSNKIVRVNIENSPKAGFWTMAMTVSSITKTASISVSASLQDIRSAINTAMGSTLSFICQDVIQTGENQYDIVFIGNVSVVVNGSGLVSSDAVVGNISFATSELIAFLGNLTIANARIEIIVEASGEQTTLVQTNCFVANAVVAAGAIGPVPVGTLLTETVANSRFVRKDIVDAPSGATQDILWQNLGVTLDGSDTVAAINASNAPASGNPFATIADVTTSNQSLNTTDAVSFANVNVTNGSASVLIDPVAGVSLSGSFSTGIDSANLYFSTLTLTEANGLNMGTAGQKIVFPDTTEQTTAFVPADYYTASFISSNYQSVAAMSSYLTTSTAASTYLTISTAASTYLTTSAASSTYLDISTAASTYAPITDFDQGVKTTDTPTFAAITLASGVITFADFTTQDTRVVRENQSNSSGYTNASFYTHYPYEVKVIDDSGTAYWVPARFA